MSAILNLIGLVFSTLESLWWNLRGGSAFSQFFFSLWLGLALGMLPLTGLGAVILLLLLFFNSNIVLVTLSAGLGHFVSHMIHQALIHAGSLLLEHGIQPWLPHLIDKPLLALMSFEQPYLWGTLGFLLVALPLVYGIATILQQLQRSLEATQRPNFILALLVDERSGVHTAYQVHSLWSIQRFCTGILVLLASFIFLIFTVDSWFQHWLDNELTTLSGYDVRMDEADLSILSGNFSIQQLSMVDPRHPDMELFHAIHLEGDMEWGDLLHNNLVIPKLVIEFLWLENPITEEARIRKDSQNTRISLVPDASPTEETSYQSYSDALFRRFASLPDFLAASTKDNPRPLWIIEKMTLKNIMWMDRLPHYEATYDNLSPYTLDSGIETNLTLSVEKSSLKALGRGTPPPILSEEDRHADDLQKVLEESYKALR